jgi:hypothetical protein
MENKQTAVEWLIEQIKEDQTIKAKTMDEWNTVFHKSKAMEKKQIIDACNWIVIGVLLVGAIYSLFKSYF